MTGKQNDLTELRDSCLNCVRKHLSQALVLMQEVHQGYPHHRWIAIGHMGEAADEALKKHPKLADEIRKHRLNYMADANYDVPIMDLIEKASKLAGDLSEACDHKFMPDWKDSRRKWSHVGGDLEASYDGARYVDFRVTGKNERPMFASRGLLRKALLLFQNPIAEDLSLRELSALDVMSERRGFRDEFWIEHRKRIKSGEFSEAFAEWLKENSREDETREQAWFRHLREERAESSGAVRVGMDAWRREHDPVVRKRWLRRQQLKANRRRAATIRKKKTDGLSARMDDMFKQNGNGKKSKWAAPLIRADEQQEDDMAFTVTNLNTGEIVTSEGSRREFLAEAARKREILESGEKILFWSEEHKPQDYEDCVLSVSDEKVTRVIEALQGGENVSQMRGWANCRICDENLGSADLAGHGFVWPSLAEHYVTEHGVWTPALDKFATLVLADEIAEGELDEPQLNEGDAAKDPGKHCGVFIPLPYSLAKDFPDKKSEDSSVPHYTILYVGDLSPKGYKVFCNLVRRFAQKVKPFECDTYAYGEFLNKEGQKIAHMRPSPHCGTSLALIHSMLRRFIEEFGKEIGASIKHSYGHEGMSSSMVPYEIQFKPHATLAYMPAIMPYTGPKPTGGWRVTELECWGYEQIRIPLGQTKADQPIGLTRDPLAIKYPMAVPNAVREDVVGGSMGAMGKGVGGSDGDIGLAGSLPYQSVIQKIKNKLERKKLAGLTK